MVSDDYVKSYFYMGIIGMTFKGKLYRVMFCILFFNEFINQLKQLQVGAQNHLVEYIGNI